MAKLDTMPDSSSCDDGFQQADHEQAQSRRQQRHSSSISAPTHPFALSLPQLTLDGSVIEDSLTAHQSSLRHYTPPAALSTLGARLRMANGSGTASFMEEQYDMIDDLSEISNDDHDTASLTSGSTGQPSPVLSASLSNLDDIVMTETSLLRTESYISDHDPIVPFPRFVDPSIGEEEVAVQSYMSEELETPRQSTLAASILGFDGGPNTHVGELNQPTTTGTYQPLEILTVSEPDYPFETMQNMIMNTIVANMQNTQAFEVPTSENLSDGFSFDKGTITRRGVSQPAIEVHHESVGHVASLYRCEGVEARAANSYSLQIKDPDGLHSTKYTIGSDGKINLPPLNVALIFLHRPVGSSNKWLELAHKAISTLNVPIMVVRKPGFRRRIFGFDFYKSHMLHTTTKQVQVDDSESGRPATISSYTTIHNLLQHRPVRSFTRRFLSRTTVALAIAALLATFVQILALKTRQVLSSSDLLLERRDALHNSLESSGPARIDHLLPRYMADCFTVNGLGAQHVHPSVAYNGQNCSSVFYDVLTPSAFIIALPGLSRFPRVTSTEVYRRYSGAISHNTTQLIPGVWRLDIDPTNAHGMVHVNMTTTHPPMNVTMRHHFGGGSSVAVREVGRVLIKDAAAACDLANNVKDQVIERVETLALEWDHDWKTWSQNLQVLSNKFSDMVKDRVSLSRERAGEIGIRLAKKAVRASDQLKDKIKMKKESRLARKAERKEARKNRRAFGAKRGKNAIQ